MGISKFKAAAYLLPLFFITAILLYARIVMGKAPDIQLFYIVPALIGLPAFNAMRTKAISITFDKDSMIVRRFLGVGRKKQYDFNEIDGYCTAHVLGRYTKHNYIYMMRGGKKIAKISAQYHSNFKGLEYFIANNFIHRGDMQSNVATEIADALS